MPRKPKFLPAVQTFVDLATSRIGPALAEFGFAPEPLEFLDKHVATVGYRNGNRYVEARITLHPRDLPFHGNIVLGEGSRSWPEADWNSVALWQLIHAHPGGDPKASVYRLTSDDEVPNVVEAMRADLLCYAGDFLGGGVEMLRKIRGEVNHSREPYKIYRPAEDGGYKSEIDPESAALKERFSR